MKLKKIETNINYKLYEILIYKFRLYLFIF